MKIEQTWGTCKRCKREKANHLYNELCVICHAKRYPPLLDSTYYIVGQWGTKRFTFNYVTVDKLVQFGFVEDTGCGFLLGKTYHSPENALINVMSVYPELRKEGDL